MTPKEIAAYLRAQKTFNETTLAPLDEYIQVKRATGAPVDLERGVMHAALAAQSATNDLVEHLDGVVASVQSIRAELAASSIYNVGYRPTRLATEYYLAKRAGAVDVLLSLLYAWESLADRIVATDEDRAAYAAKRRQFKIDELSNRTARDLRALAKAQGLKVGTNCREIATALVDSGYEP